MALSTLGGLWLCSLVLSGALGWMLGRWQRAFPTLFALVTEVEIPAAQGPAEPVSNQEPVLQPPPKRPHIFNDMPPVEWVRAQAKTILEAESVWELPELREELYLGHVASVHQTSSEPDERATTTQRMPLAGAKSTDAEEPVTSVRQSSSCSALV